MKLNRENIVNVCIRVIHRGLDAAVFTGIGFLAGHAVNHLAKFAKPGLLSNPLIDIKSALISCGIFIIVDTIFQEALQHIRMPDYIKPHLSIAAKLLSGATAIGLLQVLPAAWKIVPIKPQVAAGLLLATGVIYIVVIKGVQLFDHCRKSQTNQQEVKPNQEDDILGLPDTDT